MHAMLLRTRSFASEQPAEATHAHAHAHAASPFPFVSGRLLSALSCAHALCPQTFVANSSSSHRPPPPSLQINAPHFKLPLFQTCASLCDCCRSTLCQVSSGPIGASPRDRPRRSDRSRSRSKDRAYNVNGGGPRDLSPPGRERFGGPRGGPAGRGGGGGGGGHPPPSYRRFSPGPPLDRGKFSSVFFFFEGERADALHAKALLVSVLGKSNGWQLVHVVLTHPPT